MPSLDGKFNRHSQSSSERILGFVHYLRASNFSVGTEQAALISKCLTDLKEPDIRLSRSSFRALCCGSKQDWLQFDSLFNQFWLSAEHPLTDTDDDHELPVPTEQKGGVAGIGGGADAFHEFIDLEKSTSAGSGKQTTLSKADFRFLNNQHAMHKIEILAEQLAKSIRPVKSRRRRRFKTGSLLDLGATLRAGVRTGGLPVVPWYSKRHLQPPGIVILHDVSHSMTFNNPMLVRFSRGLVRRFKDARAFVYHTRLYPVTSIFRESSLQRMQYRLEENNSLWLGGTCIADSLEEFRNEYARSTLKSSSVVIIISDGFDSNHPERLASELIKLNQSCRKIIWLNPMLDREGFNPEKEEVWNVQRHVEALLPAHSLEALKDAVIAISK